jgi:hypothetical protein
MREGRWGFFNEEPKGRVSGASTLEEVTISTVAPMMAVFNNFVIFDQHTPQNTLQSIVPDLATSCRGTRTAPT